MLSAPFEEDDNGNLLINFNDLKSCITPNLAVCPTCSKCKLDIKKVMISGYYTGLEVTCQTCTTIELQERHQLRHLKDRISRMHGKERKKLVRQLKCLKTKLTVTMLNVQSRNQMRL